MEETASYAIKSEPVGGKNTWPVVIGVLSCVLAGQSLIGDLSTLVYYYCVIPPVGRNYLHPFLGPWKHVVLWGGVLASIILLTAGVVLLREWFRGGKTFPNGKLLHQIYAWISILWLSADKLPVFFFIYFFFLGKTGLDGKMNPTESRIQFALMLATGLLTELARFAYPVFLLIWFRKHKRDCD